MSYNNIICILLFYLIEIIKILLVLWGILGFQFIKEKFVYLIMLIPPIFIIITKQLPHEDFVQLYESVMPFLIITTTVLILKGKILKKIAFSLLSYITIMFFDICVAGILSIAFNTTLAGISEDPFINVVGNSINIIVFITIVLIKRNSNKHVNAMYVSRNIYTLFFVGVCIGIFFIASLMIANLPGAEDGVRKTLLVLGIGVIFAYFAGCIMLVFITYSRDNYKRQLQINEEIILSQQKYYTLVNEKQQEIKAIRHEMKNHLTCIDALFKSNKMEELHEYIKGLIEESKVLDELFDTGNDIVNAILNDAQSRHKQRIGIELKGAFPAELHITSMDLCVIFANAINNAVEAIYEIDQMSKERHKIYIQIGTFKDDLFINISNPVKRKVNVDGGKIKTTKEDKNYHGFGISNMRQVVKDYGGSIELKSNNKILIYRFI